MDKQKVFMMVGLPASGKSTVAKRLAEENDADIFSSDEYRKKLLNDESCQSNNALIFDTLYKDLKNDVLSGRNVVFDATNIHRKSRTRLFQELHGVDCDINAYVMTTPFEDCKKRDASRDRTVGEDVIKKFLLRFEMPQKFEGFSNIYIDGIEDTMPKFNPYLMLLYAIVTSDFDQKNKHHVHGLYTHCSLLAENYCANKVLYTAGFWHDIGKAFTRTFDEDGQAHYISHANYSAYWLLSHAEVTCNLTVDEFFEVLFYVNEHMHIRDIIKSDKAIIKYKKLFGEIRYNNLVEFMDNDNIASGTADTYVKEM